MEAFILKPHVNYSGGKNVRSGMKRETLAACGQSFPNTLFIFYFFFFMVGEDTHSLYVHAEGTKRYTHQQRRPTSAGRTKVKTNIGRIHPDARQNNSTDVPNSQKHIHTCERM